MAAENLSVASLVGSESSFPFGLGILMFLIAFLAAVVYSFFILWLVVKLFRLKNDSIKTAFFTSLVANAITSAALIGLLWLIRLIFVQIPQTPFSGKGFKVAAGLLLYAAIFIANLLVARRFYKDDMRKLFYAVLIWTIIVTVAGAVLLPMLQALIGKLVLSLYPQPVHYIKIT